MHGTENLKKPNILCRELSNRCLYNSNKLTNQMQQFYKFITWRFVSLNMFREPQRPSLGAYNCINRGC
jgi:hypothetical protein